MADDIERLALRAAWIGLDDVPIVFVNQILGQVDDQGELIITFGQATPPVLLGTEEEQRDQARNIQFVQVRPVTRMSLTGRRTRELIGILQTSLDNQERVRRALDAGGPA